MIASLPTRMTDKTRISPKEMCRFIFNRNLDKKRDSSKTIEKMIAIVEQRPLTSKKLSSGQSYKAPTIVIYDYRVIPDLKLPHITTLES